MSIVTKKGDKGKTFLYCGKKVDKDDVRVEVIGAIDEASSFLGLAKSASKDKMTKRVVDSIQKDLVWLCAEVATSAESSRKIRKKIDTKSICVLEREIDCLEGKCAIKLRSFCIPGNGAASSALDVARAVTRRAERRSVTLQKRGLVKNPNIVIYLNRLSDLLYLLARLNEEKK